MPDFETLDELQKHYGRAIKAAGDDEEAVKALHLEQREATADFRERVAVERELAAHRTAVAASLPAGAAELLSGTSIEELDASAAKLKAWAEGLQKVAEPTAGELYGSPAAGGGEPPARRDEIVEEIDDFQKRFNLSNRGSRVRTSPSESTATYNVNEGDRWVQRLGAARLIAHLAANSSKPSVREALSQIDPKNLKVKGGGDRVTI